MNATYAYCPACRKDSLGPTTGNAIVVANESHLELVQEGHSNWAGTDAWLHQLLAFTTIPESLQKILVFGMLPSSSTPLVEK